MPSSWILAQSLTWLRLTVLWDNKWLTPTSSSTSLMDISQAYHLLWTKFPLSRSVLKLQIMLRTVPVLHRERSSIETSNWGLLETMQLKREGRINLREWKLKRKRKIPYRCRTPSWNKLSSSLALQLSTRSRRRTRHPGTLSTKTRSQAVTSTSWDQWPLQETISSTRRHCFPSCNNRKIVTWKSSKSADQLISFQRLLWVGRSRN